MSNAEAAPALPTIAQEDDSQRHAGEGYFGAGWRRLRRNRGAMACLVILSAICLISAAAPWINEHIVGYDPNRGRLLDRFQSPSSDHWLGTDEFGRDTLARLIAAGRVSLTIGFTVAAIQLSIGVSLGLIAAFYGKYVDDGVNAVIQVFNNIPTLFVLIMLSVLFRPGILGLSLIFGILLWPGAARLVRGRVLSERRRDYVDAAMVIGASDLRVMYRHILPNVFSIVLVLAGFDVAGAILAEAGLSALGFGVQIPTASWGNMLQKSLDYFNAWWLVLAPGVMITLTVFCLIVVADALRDALDPRLKS
jgi:peptide/nickel transport system permease protein